MPIKIPGNKALRYSFLKQYITPVIPNINIIDIPINPSNLSSIGVCKNLYKILIIPIYKINNIIKIKFDFFWLIQYTEFPKILKIICINGKVIIRHIKKHPKSKTSLEFNNSGNNKTNAYIYVMCKVDIKLST